VRALVQEERRRTAREISAEAEILASRQSLLAACNRVYDPETWQGLADDVERSRYNLKLMRSRMKHLDALNPKNHAELPHQMHEAARLGDARYVELGCEAGVPLNLKDEKGMTPLIVATVANKVSVVKVLLEFCADPSVQDHNGATCAHYAVQLNHIHAFAALLDVHPREYWDVLTIRDTRGCSAIDYTRREDRKPCQQLLRNRVGGPVVVLGLILKRALTDRLSRCSCSSVTKARQGKGAAAEPESHAGAE